MSLEGRHILLGITGSIAAYKAAILCRLLGGQIIVSLGIHLNGLQRLPGVLAQQSIQLVFQMNNVVGMNFNVRGLPLKALHQRLVNHDFRIGKCQSLALRTTC